jgi:hypothetical protein
LENLSAREREAGAARVAFQEVVIATNNRDVGKYSQVHHFGADQRKHSIERMGAQHLGKQAASQKGNKFLSKRLSVL